MTLWDYDLTDAFGRWIFAETWHEGKLVFAPDNEVVKADNADHRGLMIKVRLHGSLSKN